MTNGETFITWNFLIVTVHQILFIMTGIIHIEELHSLYRSLNIVRVIKSRRLRWAGHIARMEEGRSAFKILTGTPAEKSL